MFLYLYSYIIKRERMEGNFMFLETIPRCHKKGTYQCFFILACRPHKEGRGRLSKPA
jgi:hypothetical protein